MEGTPRVFDVSLGLIKLERKIWNKKQKEDKLGMLSNASAGIAEILWQS